MASAAGAGAGAAKAPSAASKTAKAVKAADVDVKGAADSNGAAVDAKVVADTKPTEFTFDTQTVYLDGTRANFAASLKALATWAKQEMANEGDNADTESNAVTYKYIWKAGEPLPIHCTTITCKDGNIKGNHLLTFLRDSATRLLASFQVEHEATEQPFKFLAQTAGKWAKFKTKADAKGTYEPQVLVFGLSEVKLTLTDKERVEIQDQKLRAWIRDDLKLPVQRWDLPWRGYGSGNPRVYGINDVYDAIIRTLVSYAVGPNEKPKKPIPPREFGALQLYCAFPKAEEVNIAHIDNPYYQTLKQGQLRKWLDFVNFLIFGMEASRNNTVFVTGLLTLIRMRAGGATVEDMIDSFPLATTNTGKSNFIAENMLVSATRRAAARKLSPAEAVGFGLFRANRKWLACAVKSVTLLLSWFANFGELEDAKSSTMVTIFRSLGEHLADEMNLYCSD